MIQDLPIDLVDRAETESERALIRCLMNCNMMLDTYRKETDNVNRMLLISGQMDINEAAVLNALGLPLDSFKTLKGGDYTADQDPNVFP